MSSFWPTTRISHVAFLLKFHILARCRYDQFSSEDIHHKNITGVQRFRLLKTTQTSTMVLRSTFLLLARGILGRSSGRRDSQDRDYKALFGVSLRVTCDVWNVAGFEQDRKLRPKHLLWALLMMKTNSSQSVLAALTQTTRKTF